MFGDTLRIVKCCSCHLFLEMAANEFGFFSSLTHYYILDLLVSELTLFNDVSLIVHSFSFCWSSYCKPNSGE